MREAIEFLEKINPSFKNQDITKINTFGGEFLIYCVQKALEKNNNLEKAIKKASKNLIKIKDVDTWVNDIKEGKI